MTLNSCYELTSAWGRYCVINDIQIMGNCLNITKEARPVSKNMVNILNANYTAGSAKCRSNTIWYRCC